MCIYCGNSHHTLDDHYIESEKYFNIVEIVDETLRKKYEVEMAVAEWQILEEERLELKIIQWFNDQKKETLKRFKKFEDAYVEKNYSELNTFLNSIGFKESSTTIEPVINYNNNLNIKFKRYKLPAKVNDYFNKQKDPSLEIIDFVSEVNTNPFKDSLDDSIFRSYNAGGQRTFGLFNINLQFNMRDKNVENFLRNHAIQLSDQVGQSLQSDIKFEILDGIRNSESSKEIRKRILKIYDKPINVVVPAKLDKDGNIIRNGYTYDLAPKVWAQTVSTTEIGRAYTEGSIEGWKQMDVVEEVIFSVTPDERLCPICAPFEDAVYKLSEASGIIPLHPRCRCTFIPKLEDFEASRLRAISNLEELYSVPTALETLDDERKLQTGDIKSQKNLGGGINTVKRTSNGIEGIWKPLDGEYDDIIRDGIPIGTQYKREVAAYKFDRVFNFDLVPTTAQREINGVVGSHQKFLKDYKTASEGGIDILSEKIGIKREKMGFFDYLIASEDRHRNNWMIDKNFNFKLIDNGLSFPMRKYTPVNSALSQKIYGFNPVKNMKKEIVFDKKININFWDKIKDERIIDLLKTELYDSSLLETDAFKGLLSRIKFTITSDGRLLKDFSSYSEPTMSSLLKETSSLYENKTVEEAIKDLKNLIKKTYKDK